MGAGRGQALARHERSDRRGSAALAAERFGSDFFDVSMLTGMLVLLGFLVLFAAITVRLLRGRLKY